MEFGDSGSEESSARCPWLWRRLRHRPSPRTEPRSGPPTENPLIHEEDEGLILLVEDRQGFLRDHTQALQASTVPQIDQLILRQCLSAYVTSKTALIRFTEIVALEAGVHGVMVFAIEPGTVRTAMAEYALKSDEGKRWLPWLGEVFKRGEDVPPDRAADLVVLLGQGEPTLSPVGSSRSRMKLWDSLSGLVVRVLVTCRLFG